MRRNKSIRRNDTWKGSTTMAARRPQKAASRPEARERTPQTPEEEQPSPACDSPASSGTDPQDAHAAELFVRGLLTRGEAAKAMNGELPPEATHEIVADRDGEIPKLERRRFSLY